MFKGLINMRFIVFNFVQNYMVVQKKLRQTFTLLDQVCCFYLAAYMGHRQHTINESLNVSKCQLTNIPCLSSSEHHLMCKFVRVLLMKFPV